MTEMRWLLLNAGKAEWLQQLPAIGGVVPLVAHTLAVSHWAAHGGSTGECGRGYMRLVRFLAISAVLVYHWDMGFDSQPLGCSWREHW